MDFMRWDAPALAASWRRARPFPHVILDDLLAADELQALREEVARTPHFPNHADFYEMMASSEELGPAASAFRDALDGPGRELVARVTGKSPARVSLRSYVYLAGGYLLPHNDMGAAETGRVIAWAYYLLPRERCEGGELELFDCTLDGDEIIGATPALRIEPVENRLVVFDVSPRSLHQVLEVTSGGRVSLSGWFYQ
jgi:Rps23 Pro-64 3,4-dihydroxylase Tpa1-like proline 4-hydroxylase